MQRLLKHHYGPDKYQEVPDRHGGDLGLEGFSTDGCAFQCYAVEGYADAKTVFERQRDKLSADIKKFIDNRDLLIALFGTIQIRRWLLVVPDHVSRKLVSHASVKTVEVLGHNLPYVTTDFLIMIITDDNFAVAREQLARVGLVQVHLVSPAVSDTAVASWAMRADNSPFIANISEKAARIPALQSLDQRKRFVADMLHKYLRGQAVLQGLHDSYPAVFNQILQQKIAREELLTVQSQIADQGASALLNTQLTDFRSELEEAVQGIAPQDLSILVNEAIADWLGRCPLDFPGAQTS